MIFEIYNQDGAVINTILASLEFVEEHYPGHFKYIGEEPKPVEPRIITKTAMLTRFTDDEFVGVLVEARTDAEVEAWYAKFNAATTIDLDDSRTKAGITMLYIKSLLSEERATAILTMPVQPNERP
jgi:hypothetical protein